MSGLLEEIKQTKPFASKEEEVLLNLQRTAAALSWAFADLLKPFELTGVQYNVLRILRGAGSDGIKCSEISERLVTKDSDITRLLDRLETRNLIQRERDCKDRRVILIRITENGLQILTQLDEPATTTSRRQLEHLGADQLELLNKLLVAARSNLA
ncbi:MAG: MarR family transcriptional regulator [Pyrinomonadaceae bacterium]